MLVSGATEQTAGLLVNSALTASVTFSQIAAVHGHLTPCLCVKTHRSFSLEQSSMAHVKAFALAAIVGGTAGTPALATTSAFNISGSGVSGSIVLTLAPNPNTGVLPGTSPNPVDPIGSYVVTGINGSFSDSNLGLTNLSITGIVPSNPAHPEPTNLLAPHSFGFYPILSGVTTPGGTAPGLSYDNLFYPAGSPQTASDYPFHGGVFDIYGIVFTIAGGDAVNLWSNGNMGSGVSYGVGVTDGATLLDYAQPVALSAVPELRTWVMMLLGFGAVGFMMRRRRTVQQVQTT